MGLTGQDKVGVLSWEMQLNDSTFRKQVKSSAGSLKDLGEKGSKSLSSVTAKFTAALAGAVALTVGLKKLSAATLVSADNYAKTSARLGLTIENYQGLAFAARQTGVSIADLDSAIEKLNRSTGDAANGNKKQIESFERLGLTVEQVLNVKGVERFKLVAEAIKGIDSPAQKASISNAILGRSVQKVVTLLNLGEDGLQKYIDRSNELGAITKEQAGRIEAFNDKIDELKTGFSNISTKILSNLLPALQSIGSTFQDSAEEAAALWDQMLKIGVFAADAEFKFQESARPLEIAKAMSQAQKERNGLLGKTNEEIAKMFVKDGKRWILQKELRDMAIAEKEAKESQAKIQAKADRDKKGLSGFASLDQGLNQALRMKTIKEQAGLTAEEFEKMSPAIKKALEDEVKLVDIVKKAQETAAKHKHDLNKKTAEDARKLAENEAQRESKALEAKQKKARQARIKELREFVNKQDPKKFASRAMAGSIEEFKILSGQDNTAKKTEQNTKRAADELARLEAI